MTAPFARIAAIADLHIRSQEDVAMLADAFVNLHHDADLLLIAGDITEMGRVAEMELFAGILAGVSIPTFVIFGNHDRRGMRRRALASVLRTAGTIVLDGTGAIATMPHGGTIGIAGITGSGGGFSDQEEQFGPGARFTRAVMTNSRRESARLRKIMRELREQHPDILIVLSHFSPTTTTLGDEPPLKYWMLGNRLLGSTIDEFSPNLVIHGHSHLGNERGATPGGTPVQNVAFPVVGGIRILEVAASGVILPASLRPVQSQLAATRVRESDAR